MKAKEFIADKITAKQIKTEELCVGRKCVTEKELEILLEKAGIQVIEPTPETTPELSPILEPEPILELTPSPTQESTPTPSPEPTPEPTA